MATIQVDEVRTLAGLAQLSLTETEIAGAAAALGDILETMAALASVDTTGAEPMSHPTLTAMPLRADIAEPSLSQSLALASSADTVDGCFRVPAVIEEES